MHSFLRAVGFSNIASREELDKVLGLVMTHPTLDKFAFTSDNYSGIHPDILQAITNANGGHQKAYGDDIYTQKLGELIKERFGQNASCYPVFNGTGANITALIALSPRFGA